MANKKTGGRTTEKKKKDKTGGISDFREMMNRKGKVRTSINICVDPDAVDARSEAKGVFERAKTMATAMPNDETRAAELEAAEAALDQAEADYLEASVTFKIESLGGIELEDLMALHKPEQKHQKQVKDLLREQGMPTNGQSIQYNPDTFPMALMSRAIVSPAMTEEEAQEMWTSDQFNRGERTSILGACFSVNDIVM